MTFNKLTIVSEAIRFQLVDKEFNKIQDDHQINILASLPSKVTLCHNSSEQNDQK